MLGQRWGLLQLQAFGSGLIHLRDTIRIITGQCSDSKSIITDRPGGIPQSPEHKAQRTVKITRQCVATRSTFEYLGTAQGLMNVTAFGAGLATVSFGTFNYIRSSQSGLMVEK